MMKKEVDGKKVEISDAQYWVLSTLYSYDIDVMNAGRSCTALVKKGLAERKNGKYIMTPFGYKVARALMIS